MAGSDVGTRAFWAAAGKRALRSFAQALLTLGGLTLAGLFSERWGPILIAAAGYAGASVLTSIVAGVPEAPSPLPPPDPPAAPF